MTRIAILLATLFTLVGCGEDSIESRATSAVDSLCACKDERCVESAEKRLKKIGREIEKKESSMSEEQLDRLEALKDRAEMCESGQGDPESKENKEALAKVTKQFDEIADEVCDCKDKACAEPKLAKLTTIAEAVEEESGLSENLLMNATEKSIARMFKCFETLN